MPLVVTVQISTTLSHQNQKIANPYSVRMEMDYLAQEKMELLVQEKLDLLVQVKMNMKRHIIEEKMEQLAQDKMVMDIDQQKKIWTVTLN